MLHHLKGTNNYTQFQPSFRQFLFLFKSIYYIISTTVKIVHKITSKILNKKKSYYMTCSIIEFKIIAILIF